MATKQTKSQVPVMWNGKPGIKYIFRAAIKLADRWESLNIPKVIDNVVYIRLKEESGNDLDVCEVENPPDNNPDYYTLAADDEKEWKTNRQGIPGFISVRSGTAARDYYYEYIILK